MGATVHTLDMNLVEGRDDYGRLNFDARGRPSTRQGGRPVKSTHPKAIRARLRRQAKTMREDVLITKPIEEWDLEELAKGRPKDRDGFFRGRPPTVMPRQLHEEIVNRFAEIVKTEMRGHTVAAMKVLGEIIDSDERDENGKPIVSANVKLDATKFLIEHIIGKPKQRVETDISVKLQGMLAQVMVAPQNPNELVSRGTQFQVTQGYIEAAAWEDDDDEPRE